MRGLLRSTGVGVLALAAPVGGHAAEKPARAADHVIVLMLDGARPDVLRVADAPNLHRLAEDGAQYVQAQTTYPSQTRVAFVSLPTGAYPGHHGIVGGGGYKDADWKLVDLGDTSGPEAVQPLVAVPTMFEAATAAGLTSVYAAMKGYELVGARGATWTINGKKTIPAEVYEWRYTPQVSGSAELAFDRKVELSTELMRQFLVLYREKQPNLAILNLGTVDYVGHAFGPETVQYRRAMEAVDGLVGVLLKALDDLKVRDRTTIVVSADHGFSGVDPHHVVAPAEEKKDHELAALTARHIEHWVTDTGGTSMGVFIRDKSKVAEAVAALREQSWCEAVYCEAAAAHCDRSLGELHAYFPGRSPDLMVDLDDDVALSHDLPGNHGSLRPNDMRIPLFLSGAGVRRGKTFGHAGLVDVAPTALTLLGVDPRALKADGRVLEEALVH